jgi:hypothetical protein
LCPLRPSRRDDAYDGALAAIEAYLVVVGYCLKWVDWLDLLIGAANEQMRTRENPLPTRGGFHTGARFQLSSALEAGETFLNENAFTGV